MGPHELRARIEADLGAGIPVAVAAQRANVSRRSLHRWLSDGRVTRPPPTAPPPLVTDDRPLPELLAEAEPDLIEAIDRAAQRGSWQAAAWYLERAFPDRWARREAGPEPGPMDAFSELDELAARRRAHATRSPRT